MLLMTYLTDAQKLEALIQRAVEKYETTTVGRIWNRNTDREVIGSIDHKGYRYLTVWVPELKKGKKVLFHRLIAMQHIANPENKPHINHKDGDRLNNVVCNLEWVTPQENVIDGFKRGRIISNKGIRRVKPRNCLYCNAEFIPSKSRIKTCNKSCAAKFRTSMGKFNPYRQQSTGRFSNANI